MGAGWEQALGALEQQVAQGHQLVTLWGVAGGGKSTLLQQWLGRSETASFLVDFDACGDAAEPWGYLARAVRARQESVPSIAEALSNAPCSVLALDHAERFADALAARLRELLGLAPGLTVLCASREPLRLRGEHLVELPTVSVEVDSEGTSPACRALLALAGLPRASCSETELAAAETLASRASGLPLALALLAQRLQLASASAVCQRTDDALSALQARGRDVPARHRSVRACVDSVLAALDASSRAQVLALAAAGPRFELEAAEAVLDESASGGDALPLLEALLEQRFLLRVSGENPARPRFYFLPLHRQVLLASCAPEALRRARARARAELARRVHEHHELLERSWADRAVAGLRAERSNLEEHLAEQTEHDDESATLLLGLARALWPEGRAKELTSRIDALLQGSGALSAGLRGRLEVMRGNIARTHGREAEARGAFERALSLARESADEWLRARAFGELLILLVDGGELSTAGALSNAEHAFEPSEAAPALVAYWHLSLGHFHAEALSPARATLHCEQASQALSRLAEAGPEAHFYSRLAALYADLGQLETSRELFQRALSFALTEETFTGANLRCQYGRCLLGLQDLAGARQRLEEGLAASRRLGDRWTLGYRGYLGFVQLEQGQREEALESFLDGAEHFDAAGVLRYAAVFRAAAWLLALSNGREVTELWESAQARLGAASELFAPILRMAGLARTGAGAPSRLLASDLASEQPLEVLLFARLCGRTIGPTWREALTQLEGRAAEPRVALTVHYTGWFEVSGGERVYCIRFGRLWRLLWTLAEQHDRGLGGALTATELIHAGWPDERILPAAARNRLFVSINRLRRLGLGALLATTPDGRYCFAPEVQLHLERRSFLSDVDGS